MSNILDDLNKLQKLAEKLTPTPTKEKLFYFNKADNCCNVKYVYGTPQLKVSFAIRCPNEVWNYYLTMGIELHSEKPFSYGGYHNKCNLLPCGSCYGDGSGLAGERLWDDFKNHNFDEEIIWKELQQWFERNNK